MKCSFLAFLVLLPSLAFGGYSADKSREVPPSYSGELFRISSGRHATVALAVEKFVRQKFHQSGYRVENEAGQGKWIGAVEAIRVIESARLPKDEAAKIKRWAESQTVHAVLSFSVSLYMQGGESSAGFLAFFPANEKGDVFVIQVWSLND